MAEKIAFKELIARVATKRGARKNETEGAVKDFFIELANALSDGSDISVHGFGTFKCVDRKERKGRNPATGEDLIIPASRVIAFKQTKKS